MASIDVNIGGCSFSRGFSQGFKTLCLYPASATFIPRAPEVIIDVSNWTDCGLFPTIFWDKDTECKNNERELYDIILEDAFNTYAVPLMWYPTTYNTDYDKVFGEDRDRYILRTFMVNAHYELPNEVEIITPYGIESIDELIVYISMDHFDKASTYSGDVSGVYPSYLPQAGDLFKAIYNDYYYEVLYVKKSELQFMQKPHTWSIYGRLYKDIHLTLSASVSSDSLSAYIDQNDYLAINDEIDVEKQDIIITSADDIANGCKPPQDIFGGW